MTDPTIRAIPSPTTPDRTRSRRPGARRRAAGRDAHGDGHDRHDRHVIRGATAAAPAIDHRHGVSATPAAASPAGPPRGAEPRWPAIVFGVILIVVGLWFFAEVTLGLDLPTIR